MEKQELKITVKQSKNISKFTNIVFEYAILSAMIILYFVLKFGFDWVYILVFGIPLVLLILAVFIIKKILSIRYFKIDTELDLFEVRRLFKAQKYSLSNIVLKAKVKVDDGKDFFSKMKFYSGDKKIYSINNRQLVPHHFAKKSFYGQLRNIIKVEEI